MGFEADFLAFIVDDGREEYIEYRKESFLTGRSLIFFCELEILSLSILILSNESVFVAAGTLVFELIWLLGFADDVILTLEP